MHVLQIVVAVVVLSSVFNLVIVFGFPFWGEVEGNIIKVMKGIRNTMRIQFLCENAENYVLSYYCY